MEVATSFIASVVPPPFQKGTEEARRSSQLREPIPQTGDSQASSRGGQAADERGATSLQNSQLYAQSEALTQAGLENVRERNGGRGQASGKSRADEKSSEKKEDTSGGIASTNHATAGDFGTISSLGVQFSPAAAGSLGEENAIRTGVIATRYATSGSYSTKGDSLNLMA
mgnify:CR=1 FL=1